MENKLDTLGLTHVVRPVPLSRQSLDWAYVFVVLTEGDERRLQPGPFDEELAGVAGRIEEEKRTG